MAKPAAASNDRLVTPERAEEDSLESSLRPKHLAEFVVGVLEREDRLEPRRGLVLLAAAGQDRAFAV